MLEHAVQLGGREAGFQFQLLRALDRRVARRQQLLAQDREDCDQRAFDSAQLVWKGRHVGCLVGVGRGQPFLEVVVEACDRGVRTRDAARGIHEQRLVSLDDHAQVEELQQDRLGPNQDPRDPFRA